MNFESRVYNSIVGSLMVNIYIYIYIYKQFRVFRIIIIPNQILKVLKIQQMK